MSDLVSKLNPQQAEAVTHYGTPLLIVAGAGSGKTRVITHRIAWLAREVGIPLWQVLAVTFTNKAAREMRERVCRLLGVPDDPSLSISTFHSRCASILRREADAAGLEKSFAILDDRDQETAIRKAMQAVGVDDKKVRPGQAQNFVNLAKMKLLTPQDCAAEFDSGEIPYAAIYREYDELLKHNNSLDFEDLIFRTVLLFRANAEALERWRRKYRHLLVDEFQDTNFSQFELIKLLAGDNPDICVVGDEDQAIYSWRGADVRNLLDFREAFPNCKLVRLEQNYRSTGNVLKAAGAVIAKNTMRIGKTLWTEHPEGDPLSFVVGEDERDEADLVAAHIRALMLNEGACASEIAVFYRSHSLSRAVEDGVRKLRIPYRIVGATRFYDRAEIKDILSFMRLAIQPTNDLAFERVVNVPSRGVGEKTRDEIVAEARERQVSQYEAARKMVDAGRVKGKARTGLAEFLDAIAKWHDLANANADATKLLDAIVTDTRYKTDGVGDPNSIDGARRLENIEEFEAVVKEFELAQSDHSLGSFLETMALDAQREEGDDRPKISLMTIHNAKGLEFEYVFVVGLENGVFPNSRTVDNPEQFEEERRLFYVALTRARKRLFLGRAKRRMRHGSWDNTEPSIFLSELPEDMMTDAERRRLGIGGWPSIMPGRSSGASPNRAYGTAYGNVPARPWRNPQQSSPSLPAAPRQGKDAFNVGDRVEHRIMGAGTIEEAGGRFGNERVYVRFDDGREQEFVVRFASLKKIAS